MSRLIAMTTVLLVLAGCASPPLPPAEPPAAEPSPPAVIPPAPPADEPVVSASSALSVAESPASPSAPMVSEPSPAAPGIGGPVLPPGEYAILIESEPVGATVVVDGRPVGQTPLLLAFPGTARGFFRAEASIRVRFIAGDATETSSSVEEVFTPLDRIPARVVFTTTGAKRVW